ncbi:MAG: SBBP repeat-containing protein [Elusimicrobiota bacterium]
MFVSSGTAVPGGLQEVWTEIYDGPDGDADQGNDIVLDSSGNKYIVGSTKRKNTGYDILVKKYSRGGGEEWTDIYTGSGRSEDRANAAAIDRYSSIYVCGESEEGMWLRKYSAGGQAMWTKLERGYHNAKYAATDIAVDSIGNVYVSGKTRSDYKRKIRIKKYSSRGAEIWTAEYYCGESNFDTGICIDKTGDYLYVTSGLYVSQGESVWLGKYAAADGTLVWDVKFHGNEGYNDFSRRIAISDKYAYIIGETINTADIKRQQGIWVGKCSLDNGEMSESWPKVFGGSDTGRDIAGDVAVDKGGNVYLVLGEYTKNGCDIMWRAYDNAGKIIWVERFNGPSGGHDVGWGLAIGENGSVFTIGTIEIQGRAASSDIWIAESVIVK